MDYDRHYEEWAASENARKRGWYFDDLELARILEIWKDAITGKPERKVGVMHSTPEHEADVLRLPVHGGVVEIRPRKISFTTTDDNATPSPEAMHAAMMHITELWASKATIPFAPNYSPETRLLQHAYAQVYGVSLTDENGALTRAQLARLPDLCSQIRALHPDAPPPPRPYDREHPRSEQRRQYG